MLFSTFVSGLQTSSVLSSV